MTADTQQRKRKFHKYKHKIRNYLHVNMIHEDPR